MIGGNIEAVLQCKSGSEFNSIGERILAWSDVQSLWGWLDQSGGDSKYTHNAKLQDTTHIFICDYTPIDQSTVDKRMLINGKAYDVLLIDDPMGLHQQLEISLKYVG